MAAGRLTVLEGWEVAAAEWQAEAGGAWQLALQPREGAAHQAAGPTTFQQAVAAAAAAGAESANASAASAAEDGEAQQPGQLGADMGWLACGAAYDAGADPVLRQLAADAPAPLTGGYPWLDEEHLCWPGAAVYVVGRGAMLALGPCAGAAGGKQGGAAPPACLASDWQAHPCASLPQSPCVTGDLPGMRLAADRVLASLRRLDYAETPVWQAAQLRLLARLHQEAGAAGCAAAGRDDLQEATAGGSVFARLAAAVGAAAVAAPAVPLEAEGLMWQEAPPRVRGGGAAGCGAAAPRLVCREVIRGADAERVHHACAAGVGGQTRPPD